MSKTNDTHLTKVQWTAVGTAAVAGGVAGGPIGGAGAALGMAGGCYVANTMGWTENEESPKKKNK